MFGGGALWCGGKGMPLRAHTEASLPCEVPDTWLYGIEWTLFRAWGREEREREEAGHEHLGREEGGEREERRTSIKLQGEGEQAALFIVSPAHLAVAR